MLAKAGRFNAPGKAGLQKTATSQRSKKREGFSFRSFNAPGQFFQPARPTGISRRNSLPPLNAMPVVQALRPVQRVWSRREIALLGRRKMLRQCGGNNSPRASLILSASYQRSNKPGSFLQPFINAPGQFFQPALNALGPRAAFERPGRRPQVAGIHFRR